MKLFLSTSLTLAILTASAQASCPEGHISCEEAARLNGAAKIMGMMTGTSTPTIINCEEATTS
ncbi:MAG: hypothetical protein V4668_00840 [Patescibacteria group bacterium]